MRFFFISLLITIELFSQVDYSKRDKLSREGKSHYGRKGGRDPHLLLFSKNRRRGAVLYFLFFALKGENPYHQDT